MRRRRITRAVLAAAWAAIREAEKQGRPIAGSAYLELDAMEQEFARQQEREARWAGATPLQPRTKSA